MPSLFAAEIHGFNVSIARNSYFVNISIKSKTTHDMKTLESDLGQLLIGIKEELKFVKPDTLPHPAFIEKNLGKDISLFTTPKIKNHSDSR